MGTCIFVFVILTFVSPAISDIAQLLAQFNPRWILQLINSISNDIQTLLRCFSRTGAFTNLNIPLLIATDFSKILYLYLKDDELFMETLSAFPAFVTGYSSLLNFHRLPVYLYNYHSIQWNCT